MDIRFPLPFLYTLLFLLLQLPLSRNCSLMYLLVYRPICKSIKLSFHSKACLLFTFTVLFAKNVQYFLINNAFENCVAFTDKTHDLKTNRTYFWVRVIRMADKDVMLYLGHFVVSILQVLSSLLLIQDVDTISMLVQAVAASFSLGLLSQQLWSSYFTLARIEFPFPRQRDYSPKGDCCPEELVRSP